MSISEIKIERTFNVPRFKRMLYIIFSILISYLSYPIGLLSYDPKDS